MNPHDTLTIHIGMLGLLSGLWLATHRGCPQPVRRPLALFALLCAGLIQSPQMLRHGGSPLKTELPLILIVEDHPTWARRYRCLLEGAGYGVAEGASVSRALVLARTLRPALVLQDLGLPTVSGRFNQNMRNGLFLLKALREQYPGLPVIVQSGGLDLAVRREVQALYPGGVMLAKDDEGLEAALLGAIGQLLQTTKGPDDAQN